ncbi:MAG: OmpH family outer membrane protein [Planctomycetota bacterium]
MNGRHGWIGLATAMVLSLAMVGPAWGQGADRVGVIDIREVLERLDERGAVEARALKAQQEVTAERDRRVREIESLQAELLMLDGDALRAKQDEIVVLETDLEAYIKVRQSTFQRDAVQTMEAMRRKMEEAVESVAKEQGIQLVMTRAIQVTLPGPDGRPRQVPAPQVIWVAPEADITDAVIDRMNADFARQGALPVEGEAAVELASAEGSAP